MTMSRILELDPQAFADHFDGDGFRLRHSLARHPLLSVEALATLADRLPETQVEHNVGALPTIIDPDTVRRLDLTPGEIARGIERNGCWMVLKNVETAPAYRALLDAALDEVAPYVPRGEGATARREAFIFLSAASSVTPLHIDPEHNLLLQVRGSKRMHIGRYADAEREQLELERYYAGGHRNLQHPPVAEQAFELEPGDGVAVPLHAPHWVRNGPEVSVSLSLTFRSARSVRTGRLHATNARLRSAGASPRPPGVNARADLSKLAALRAGMAIARLGRRAVRRA
jgi:hypothetical protein